MIQRSHVEGVLKRALGALGAARVDHPQYQMLFTSCQSALRTAYRGTRSMMLDDRALRVMAAALVNVSSSLRSIVCLISSQEDRLKRDGLWPSGKLDIHDSALKDVQGVMESLGHTVLGTTMPAPAITYQDGTRTFTQLTAESLKALDAKGMV